MGVAIQIELVLDEAKRFEDQLQLMFMQSGRVDVWNKIKARAAALDVEAAHDARREKEIAERRKKEIDEVIELALLGVVFTAMLGVITYFVFGILEQCGGKC